MVTYDGHPQVSGEHGLQEFFSSNLKLETEKLSQRLCLIVGVLRCTSLNLKF